MKVIASMMTSMRALLIPGFRDVIGVNAAVIARVKSGECDDLLWSATQSGISGIVNYLLEAGGGQGGEGRGWQDAAACCGREW